MSTLAITTVTNLVDRTTSISRLTLSAHENLLQLSLLDEENLLFLPLDNALGAKVELIAVAVNTRLRLLLLI